MAEFDIDRFVSLSRAVDLSDIDWEEAARVGITDEEHRALRFLSDTESHTIIYLRDLLAGHTAADPEMMAFLSCWVYEETHHGRALDRLMATVGRAPAVDRYHTVTSTFSWREELTGVLSRFAATMSPHFAAAHMCWGAINELTAAASYLALARRTKNTPLAALVTKLARDERKHFSFYFHQAEKRLHAGGWAARALCKTTIRQFWKPVGIGVAEPHTLEFIASYLFGDERGAEELASIDATIRRLPGMEWFGMTSAWAARAQEWYRRTSPGAWQKHRELARSAPPTTAAA
jgi:hypothetical protein